ncbi:MAG: hypothetical protein RJA07_1147 [Bacteroidota bacterium]|jgi:hypothetical protein
MKQKSALVFLLVIFSCIAVSQAQQPLFTLIKPQQSNINFVNIIRESKDINIFKYEYLYNGGGVAIGDINNDGLPDIYFSSSFNKNKLYLNKGNFVFKDITDSAKVAGGLGFKTGITMVDINGDGWLDIFVCRSAVADTSYRKKLLYINNGNLTFTESAKAYGLDDASYSSQAYFTDFDKDGDLDLFLLNHPFEINAANKISLAYNKLGVLEAQKDTTRKYVSYRYFENNNNHFTDKTIAAGLGTYAFGLSAIIDDFNKDGYPDIYTCNDYHEPDYLFINNKNGTFTNQFDKYFKHCSYSAMGSDYADINNDGEPDLMVVDMLAETNQRQKQLKGPGNYDLFYKRIKYGFGVQYVKNVLQLNNGNQTYSDVAYLAGTAFTDWSWAPLIADFDNDGLKDIYVTNGYMRDETDMDFTVFRADSVRKALIKTETNMDAMAVLGNIPSNKINNYYFKNNGNLTFDNQSVQSGTGIPSFSNGAAYADLDNDGDLDIVVNNIYDTAFVFRNNTVENGGSNFIRFKLKGTKMDNEAFGTIVNIETADGKKQTQHYYPTKGFLSCHEHAVHFGIGKNTTVNLKVTWMNGKSQIINGLAANKMYELDIANATADNSTTPATKPYFTDITASTNINYLQKENSYIDFKLEPLLPHQFSQQGPCMAVADIDGDGKDDFFVGGSKDNEAVIYAQQENGKFATLSQPALAADKKYEDVGCAFFDADKDGDKDLLVVSGGNDYPNQPTMYPIRLYNNDGKGKFTKSDAMPLLYTSGKALAIADFDKDGDDDIFIGGRVMPGHYGLLPESFLLQNNNGKFSNNTFSALKNVGMVSDAAWCDVDNNGFVDLVLVGEWMPLTIFLNHDGKLDTTALINEHSYGWWNCITPIDINGDGNIDLVGGNIGLNTRYRGNEDKPVTMVVSDFDNNGSTDCVISLYYNDGISHPFALRDNLLDQMNFLKKKFLRYKNYANATINEVFTAEQLAKANKYKANNITNTIFYGDGKGNFSLQIMPPKAQVFPINATVPFDFDKDGKADLLIAGNDYATEVESGRNDAGVGLAIKNVGGGKFKSFAPIESGFFTSGDVKCLKPITINNQPCIIVGKNQDKIQVLKWQQ